jgi:hypothetical protein
MTGPALDGTTVGSDNDYAPSCFADNGLVNGIDTTVEFTAPAAGDYVFVAPYSGQALALYDGCQGAELACVPGATEIRRTMAAGETVLVVVDENFVTETSFTLHAFVESATEADCTDTVDEDRDLLVDCRDDDCVADPACAVTCPEDSLVGPGSLSGNVAGRPDGATATCNYAYPGASDATVDFTATATARHRFTLTQSGPWDGVVAVLDSCGGAELTCANTFGPEDVAVVDLTAGQTVAVAIDTQFGAGGAWTLDVDEIASVESTCDDAGDEDLDGDVDCNDADCAADPACAPVCPTDTLAGPGTLSGNLLGRPDAVSTTCGAPTSSDATIEFTATATARYRFELDLFASEFGTALAAFDTCGGVELACATGDIFYGVPSSIDLDLTAGQTVVLAVEPGTFYGYILPTGPWELDVIEGAPSETVCDDGLDEDLDGDTDCVDSDCTGDPSCP